MGRHRQLFNQLVLESIGCEETIDWLDFGFAPNEVWQDAEIKGLGFLDPTEHKEVLDAWAEFWPQRGEAQNWDAVGVLTHRDGSKEWLLLEAKANLEEVKSDCGANPAKSGWAKISQAFDLTKDALGVSQDADWMTGYYQYANRLAILHFLNQMQSIPARLIMVYFVGDRGDARRTCPADESGWQAALQQQEDHLGLPPDHALADRIHKVFPKTSGELL
jgi:hypothetical protein